MAFATRIKTWIAGESLSASDLNTEISIPINALSDGTKDANLAAITASSVAVSGQLTASANANVAGNVNVTGNANSNVAFANTIIGGVMVPGDVVNLGLTLSGGVLSVTAANASALSATNKGFVCMPSATAGTSVVIPVTTPITIQDDSNVTSHFTNTEFGANASNDWGSQAPFFIYAVNRGNAAVDGTDGNSAICISRSPCMTTTPSSVNNIGDKAAGPSTDDQTSIILFGTYTKANYTSKPAQLIGCIGMTYLASSHDWTIATLSSLHGLGRSALAAAFANAWNMPVAQNGAATGTYLLDNGGTAPLFTTNNYQYTIDAAGIVSINVYMNGDGGTDGSGAVQTKLSLPYTSAFTNSIDVPFGSALGQAAPLSGGQAYIFGTLASGVAYAAIGWQSSAAANSLIANSYFTNGARFITGRINYKAF